MTLKKMSTAIALIVAIAVFCIYYNFNPASYSIFPKCPFHTLTGFDCPGCGSQRAIHALLHGNFREACGYNILLIISIPFLAIHFGYNVLSLMKKRVIQWKLLYHPLTPKIIFAVVAVFWIVRNIPATPFSYLSSSH